MKSNLKESRPYVNRIIKPKITMEGKYIAYHSLPNPDLYNHLEVVGDMFKGFPSWIDFDNTIAIERNFNKKLKGLKEGSRRTLSQKLLNTVIEQYTKADEGRLKIVDVLLQTATAVKWMVTNELITQPQAHEAIISIMNLNEPGRFIGGEVPVWIEMKNMYTGAIDLLLFDPETKTLYVVDYKPDLAYNSFLDNEYVVSVPQLAAYGLIMEEIADVNLMCIMFNDEAAWVLNPNDVLAPIDAFMLTTDSSWTSPWLEFSNLVAYKKQFWARFLHREF